MPLLGVAGLVGVFLALLGVATFLGVFLTLLGVTAFAGVFLALLGVAGFAGVFLALLGVADFAGVFFTGVFLTLFGVATLVGDFLTLLGVAAFAGDFLALLGVAGLAFFKALAGVFIISANPWKFVSLVAFLVDGATLKGVFLPFLVLIKSGVLFFFLEIAIAGDSRAWPEEELEKSKLLGTVKLKVGNARPESLRFLFCK